MAFLFFCIIEPKLPRYAGAEVSLGVMHGWFSLAASCW